MAKEDREMDRMEVRRQGAVIIKTKIMKNNSRQNSDRGVNERQDQNRESGAGSSYQRTSADRAKNSDLDEKSSGKGRREKDTGLAAKDGLTGSDYDGQVTE